MIYGCMPLEKQLDIIRIFSDFDLGCVNFHKYLLRVGNIQKGKT
jgi:hypothetical protein